MQDTVYSMVKHDLEEYRQFIEKMLPDQVQIESINKVSNIYFSKKQN